MSNSSFRLYGCEDGTYFCDDTNVFMVDIERTEKAGMNEHFSKPLAMDKVIEMIGNYAGKITKI